MCDNCNLKFNTISSDIDTSYNDNIKWVEENVDLDNIGSKFETKEATMRDFALIPAKEHNFRVINLYKYEPQPGQAPIQNNSRRFCRQLYVRTIEEDNYLTYQEVQTLSNPGSRYGVTDVLTYCGNYTTDLKYTNCRHRFIRYKYDNQTGNIVRDTTQPRYIKA